MESLRQRNNIARMKTYNKQKEESQWFAFENQVVEHHRTLLNQKVWHWSSAPEEELENAGYIHDYNRVRLNRLASRKERVKGENRVADYGLDFLAAENTESEITYHGGQVKCYNSNHVTAKDLGSFMSVVHNRLRKLNSKSKGYIYTTTDLESNLAEDVNANEDILVHTKLNIEPSKRLTKLKAKNELSLYKYQTECLAEMKGYNKILLQLFCGGGKTVIAGHRIAEVNPKIIVAIAPLRCSVEQLKNRLGCFLPDYSPILVDSDTEGTTCLITVRKFIEDNNRIVIYTTYKSAISIVKPALLNIEDALALVDEAHNVNIEEAEFINLFPHSLLLTATMPESVKDILEIDTEVVCGFAKGLMENKIVDYNIWLPSLIINDDGIQKACCTIPLGCEGIEQTEINTKAMFLACGMLKTGSRRCICYFNTQEECVIFLDAAKSVFENVHGLDIWSGTIISNTSASERTRFLTEFQEGSDDVFHLLASVRILDEAIDIPKCDSEFIANVSESSSQIRFTQRLMRGCRLDASHPSKKNNCFVWAEGDESIIGSLELLRESDPNFQRKIRVMSGTYESQIETKKAILAETTRRLEIISVSCKTSEEHWNTQLQNWIRQRKRLEKNPLQTSTNLDEKRAGQWQSRQRQAYNKGILSNDRINQLKKIDGWSWEKLYTWEMLTCFLS